jgi:hypothetical protein
MLDVGRGMSGGVWIHFFLLYFVEIFDDGLQERGLAMTAV